MWTKLSEYRTLTGLPMYGESCTNKDHAEATDEAQCVPIFRLKFERGGQT